MHHFIQHTKQSRLLQAIALSCVVSCGGKGEKTGGEGDTSDSAGGSGGSGGNNVSSGGAATSGSASETDSGGTSGTDAGGASASTMTTSGGGTSATPGGTSRASGATDMGGAGAGTSGAVATLGAACDSSGELACAGNHQKVSLICGSTGEWEANQTCGTGEFCDSGDGASAGACETVVEGCEGLAPGDRFCVGTQIMACGVDAVTAEPVEDCLMNCLNGACDWTGCPADPEATICSSDCGGRSPICRQFGCPDAVVAGESGGRYVARTPAARDACELEGTCHTYYFSFAVSFDESDDEQRVRARIAAPWGLGCEMADCIIVDGPDAEGRAPIFAYTDDAGAAPTNLLIEVVDEAATCPK